MGTVKNRKRRENRIGRADAKGAVNEYADDFPEV